MLEQIDVTKRLIARHPRDLSLVRTTAEAETARRKGRIASFLGMEGGGGIGSNLAVLRQMHELGVRYLTLTHSRTLAWADSATDAPRHGGLTEFGRAVVREMNRLGMLVDLSHVSEDTMLDALDTARVPVIFSHSGARAINGHPRNVPDSVLARLPANGGVVMAVAYPAFLSEELRQWNADRAGEAARLQALFPGAPDEAARRLDHWTTARPRPLATVAHWADHIDHIRRVAGIDHVGIGGDYDGMDTGPVGAEDVSGYPALFTELAGRGYSREDLEKIASRNIFRVLGTAERFARDHQQDPPLENRSP